MGFAMGWTCSSSRENNESLQKHGEKRPHGGSRMAFAFSVSFNNESRRWDYLASHDRIISETVNLKGYERKLSWPTLRYYPRICLYELRKPTKILFHDNRSLGWPLKHELPETEAEPLPTQLRHPVEDNFKNILREIWGYGWNWLKIVVMNVFDITGVNPSRSTSREFTYFLFLWSLKMFVLLYDKCLFYSSICFCLRLFTFISCNSLSTSNCPRSLSAPFHLSSVFWFTFKNVLNLPLFNSF
jgi:hypothetical protein